MLFGTKTVSPLKIALSLIMPLPPAALKGSKPLDVITNSLLAWEVLDDSYHNVLLTGGRKRDKNISLVGNSINFVGNAAF